MSRPRKDSRFLASQEDASRATRVSAEEYEKLVSELEKVVMQPFAAAAALLHRNGFAVTKLERRAALASVVMHHRKAGLTAWMYVQIHRNFGPLMSNERVFWTYEVRSGDRQLAVKPGRVQDFSDPHAMHVAVAEFVAACLTALSGTGHRIDIVREGPA